MARFETTGLNELAEDIEKLNLSDEETDEILLAGAEQVKNAWKFAAAEHGLSHTGQMIESIGYPKKPNTVGGIKGIDIYPQGKDKKTGVRNAEKAFIQHYGTSKIKATHFVDDADALCEGEFSVVDAMDAKLGEIYEEKGLMNQ